MFLQNANNGGGGGGDLNGGGGWVAINRERSKNGGGVMPYVDRLFRVNSPGLKEVNYCPQFF